MLLNILTIVVIALATYDGYQKKMFQASLSVITIGLAGILTLTFVEPFTPVIQSLIHKDPDIAVSISFWIILGVTFFAIRQLFSIYLQNRKIYFHPVADQLGGLSFGFLAGVLSAGCLITAWLVTPISDRHMSLEEKTMRVDRFALQRYELLSQEIPGAEGKKIFNTETFVQLHEYRGDYTTPEKTYAEMVKAVREEKYGKYWKCVDTETRKKLTKEDFRYGRDFVDDFMMKLAEKGVGSKEYRPGTPREEEGKTILPIKIKIEGQWREADLAFTKEGDQFRYHFPGRIRLQRIGRDKRPDLVFDWLGRYTGTYKE